MKAKKTLMVMFAWLCFVGITHAASFDFWWPWIYSRGLMASNTVTWVNTNAPAIYYMYSRTNLWDQCLTNGTLVSSNAWTLTKTGNRFILTRDTNTEHWVSDWSNSVQYMAGRTGAWDIASGWVGDHSNDVQYMETRTGYWDSAWAWVESWSNSVQYIASRTQEWDKAGFTGDDSWIDSDSVTHVVWYASGLVTNVFTNSVSKIP